MNNTQFKSLKSGTILHHVYLKNTDGTPKKFRVKGRMQGNVKDGSAKWYLKRELQEFRYLHLNDIKSFDIVEE